jgi:S1-C subfamily serine protease
MPQGEVPLRVKFILFLLFFLGFAVNILVFLDAEHFHYVIGRPSGGGMEGERKASVELLKQSIVNIGASDCNGERLSQGTGFVVKPGYVATAAHVVEASLPCNKDIVVIDFKGLRHTAKLAGFSSDKDLAVLTVDDQSLPPLPLADSTAYEASSAVVRIFTIGYPLLGNASRIDAAAISGEGSISNFDKSADVFITSGLNLNAGNSGGPVFVADTLQVLGIARAKLDPSLGEGIGHVIPISTFTSFFTEKTKQSLP